MIRQHHTTHRHTLGCGMPLLLLENHEAAVATADIWVRTGAADEPEDLSGISHFLEHMLFKGTEKWGLGEIERAIESVGGVSNAGTSYDFTHYYVTLPAARIRTGIEMLAEMVRHSTLDAAELEKERLVILEEYRRKQDNPIGVLYELLYGELFEAGPYHLPVIGSEETIRAIDRPAMLDYYHRRYGPEGAVLVVAGDIEPERAIEWAEAAFAGFDRRREELTRRAPVRYGRGKRVHERKPTGGEVYVAYAFPAPGMQATEEVLPLDMAQFILGSGRAARLHQELKEKRGLCSSINSYYPTHAHDSLFVFVATCQPGQREGLRGALLEELRRFAAEPTPPPAMKRARRLLASSHLFSMETSSGAASNIGYYYTLSGSTEFFDSYLEKLEALTAEQVSAATARVIHPERLEESLVEISVGPNGELKGEG
ncbi:MAG TPA: pitrilysin family protein [Candidatus Sumerlaeota bacterium]|nr:pitrilysin family protein [Candidatus Sumerlaeota bacterium]